MANQISLTTALSPPCGDQGDRLSLKTTQHSCLSDLLVVTSSPKQVRASAGTYTTGVPSGARSWGPPSVSAHLQEPGPHRPRSKPLRRCCEVSICAGLSDRSVVSGRPTRRIPVTAANPTTTGVARALHSTLRGRGMGANSTQVPVGDTTKPGGQPKDGQRQWPLGVWEAAGLG